jgi:Mannosyltransferase (PIG-M)
MTGVRAAVTRSRTAFVLVTTLLCALTLGLGYANKARCIGPEFDSLGRSEPDYAVRVARDVCYSDIQQLWIGRDIDRHVFPYLSGGYTPATEQLYGGAVEYPVLTGMAIYLAAAPSSDDGQFLLWSAVLLAVAGLLTAALLAWLAGLRSWWFALAPPLVLYAFHNWDLFAVGATVVACWALLRGSRPSAAEPLAARADAGLSGTIGRRGPLLVAALALGVGATFKLYPMMFALPVALWLGTGGWRPAAGLSHPVRARWLTAAAFAAGTAGVFLLINLPFMILGWTGWWASFQFQWSRPIDLTTNTIWFWGARPYSDSANLAVQHDLAMAATISTFSALLLVCALGFLRLRRDKGYPWLQVCAAMVCGYLLFNKVHSPQFALWLLPFFVLLRIRAGWILAYFVADAAIGIGFFRWQYLIGSGMPSGSYDALSPQLVLIGVWGRAALLIALAVVFLRARVVQVPASRPNDRRPDAPGAVTELPRPDPIGPPAPSGAPGTAHSDSAQG